MVATFRLPLQGVFILWADGRASFRVVPKFVMEDWVIEIPKERIW